MRKSNEPAYPLPLGAENGLPAGISPNGLTKREYLAAMAMQGILSNPATTNASKDDVKNTAYEMADKMLERE